ISLVQTFEQRVGGASAEKVEYDPVSSQGKMVDPDDATVKHLFVVPPDVLENRTGGPGLAQVLSAIEADFSDAVKHRAAWRTAEKSGQLAADLDYLQQCCKAIYSSPYQLPKAAGFYYLTSSGWNFAGSPRAAMDIALPKDGTPRHFVLIHPHYGPLYLDIGVFQLKQDATNTWHLNQRVRMTADNVFWMLWYEYRIPSEIALGLLALGAALLHRVWKSVQVQARRAKDIVELSDSAVEADLLGRTVAHTYLLTDKIGSGGMGTVYKAYSVELQNPTDADYVAVKVIGADHLRDDQIRQRIEREHDVTKRLLHPSIVKFIDGGPWENQYYLAMELIRGQDMRHLYPGRRWPLEEAIQLLEPMFSALAYAHGQHVVHRDLKPENVMVLGPGRIKIMDFGLATRKTTVLATRMTASGTILGTPAYMPPEQISDHAPEFEPRSDQYSLGCMIFEMFAGHVPFDGDVMQVITAHLTYPPPSLHEERPDLPPAIEPVVHRMMEKQPAGRYDSLQEAWDALVEASGIKLERRESFWKSGMRQQPTPSGEPPRAS
ncbi:MAG: serine/threonine-protein kinase, partial [Candidatus Xenobia bacterium]